jgi:hypothetical protein
VDHEIEASPVLVDGLKGGVDGGEVLDVAGQDKFRPSEAASGVTRRPSASPW